MLIGCRGHRGRKIRAAKLKQRNANLKQEQDKVLPQKAQNAQSVDVSPFAPLCAFLWLLVLLSAFTDDKQTIHLNSGNTTSI
jgi:hypothetical protein